jgi:hypothetical protein
MQKRNKAKLKRTVTAETIETLKELECIYYDKAPCKYYFALGRAIRMIEAEKGLDKKDGIQEA